MTTHTFTLVSVAGRSAFHGLLLLLCWGGFSSLAAGQLSINGPATVCGGGTETYTVAGATSTANTFDWTLDGGGAIVGAPQGGSITVAWNNTQTGATYTLAVAETDGMGTPLQSASLAVGTPAAGLVCNTNVQVSLDATGTNAITPDIMLQGYFADYSVFTVAVEDALGNSFGNTVDCSNLGQTLVVRVTNTCDGNSCWGEITVADKQAPVIDCPGVKVLTCSSDPSLLPPPAATDNCSVPTLTLVAQTLDNDNICAEGVVVTRTWIATDAQGNTSLPCTEIIELTTPALPTFPEDIIWHCEQYAAFPNIIDPAPLNAAVADTDPATTPIDAAVNLSPAVLAATGSGIVAGAQGAYCAYSTSFSDDTVSICGGSFKILRDWTVFDWCTNTIVTTGAQGRDNVQAIKILDNTAPTLVNVPSVAEINVAGAHPTPCRSTGTLTLPATADNCGGTSLRIFTPIGEAVYVNGVDATDGASIPAPGLEAGVYSLLYKVSDDCGNIFETTGALSVVDVTPPVTVCDEITEIALNNLGEAVLPAAVLDDGSSDNCGIERFEVKRMGAPDFTFSESITFTCADTDQMVVLRAYDFAGNFNDCMVQVLIADKLLPTCEAPADELISCIDFRLIDPTNLAALADRFGAATTTDNCASTVVELPALVSLDQCGVGTVTRRFTSTDVRGNSVNCQQVITVFQESDYVINFPADAAFACGEPVDAPVLTTSNQGCDLLAVSMTDEYFTVGNNGTCDKLVRTWEVLNWCVPNGLEINIPHNENGVSVDSDDYSTGVHRYTYQQIIKITDDVAPTAAYTGDTDFCSLSTTDCGSAAVNLPINVADACSVDVTIEWTLDAFRDGQPDATGTGTFAGIYPTGMHRLTYLVTDACGNATELVIDFEIKDCIKPVAYCEDGLVVEIMQTGMITVWASDFNAGSFDNCSTDLTFSFSTDVTDTQRTFDCGDVGFIDLNMYITDEAGNQDFCNVIMELQDNMNACAAPTTNTVGGQLRTTALESVAGVSVDLTGSTPQLTGTDGGYNFSGIQQGLDVTVTPGKSDDVRQGVTTYDLVLISKHILGTQPFDTPYQWLAADANNSQSVSTLDIVALRKLILFMYEELPQSEAWRFVAADFVFPDAQNPWATTFPELVSINNISGDHPTVDFTAIKIGDVNASYRADTQQGQAETRTGASLALRIDDRALRAGQRVRVPVRLPATPVEGLQLALRFDRTALRLETVDYATAQPEHVHLTATDVRVSWNGTATDPTLLTLEFTAQRDGALSEYLTVGDRTLAAEAYPAQGGVRALALIYQAPPEAVFSLSNHPNPFHTATTLRFDLPEAGNAHLRIVDAAGRTVYTHRAAYAAGSHTHRVTDAAWTGAGVYRAVLEINDQQLQHTLLRFER